MSGSQPLEELRASHKAMLEALVQVLEEVLYPLDMLIPEVESIRDSDSHQEQQAVYSTCGRS